jgi:hypothetical protein
MESAEFQSVPVYPNQDSMPGQQVFDPLITDVDVADTLAVGVEWVRTHADEIPGFRRLGMYYRFHRVPFEEWLGGGERLLLPEEVAGLLKVPRSWAYANAEQIPGLIRLGRYVRFRPASIQAFLRGAEPCQ